MSKWVIEGIDYTTEVSAVRILNNALKADPVAINKLFSWQNRIPCNEELAKHKTIQVNRLDGEEKKWNIGLLGLLNGLFGSNPVSGVGKIAATYDVVCPKGHEVNDGETMGDKCKTCGEELTCGDLIEFVVLNPLSDKPLELEWTCHTKH